MERMTGRRVYKKRRGQKNILGEQEKRRLIQLGCCILLFLIVFFAKGIGRLEKFRLELSEVLQTDVDFQSAFANLGWSVASGKPVGKALNELWLDVFLPQEKEEPSAWQEGPLYQETRQNSGTVLAMKISETSEQEPQDPLIIPSEEPTATPPGLTTAVEPEVTPEPQVIHVDYNGPALPENTTMDRYALGLSETVSPVMARLTSEFGWREHPIEGGEKFHCGVDLGVESGTDVLAFAAGVVDYIGESDAYGLYLQLRHDNGVTSFYAHCSKLCVQQGQTVALGEKVAESGATGEVTGPHLHFEMRKDGVRLNPAYYIETLA